MNPMVQTTPAQCDAQTDKQGQTTGPYLHTPPSDQSVGSLAWETGILRKKMCKKKMVSMLKIITIQAARTYTSTTDT